ncbi:MAG: c-type cytochrome [Acetobacteraceae bacterium]
MKPALRLLVPLLGWILLMPAARAATAPAVALGRRLYRHGISVSGKPLQAVTAAGEPLLGAQGHCVTCHRPSGYGASEGGVLVPPITGPILFHRATAHRYGWRFADMFKQIQPPGYEAALHRPALRPAYTQQSLAVLLRDGRNPLGRTLPDMPRYRLSPADVAALTAYLRTLSARLSPGVGPRHLYLATIFTDNVPPARRRAVLATLRAFISWANRNTIHYLDRPGFSPYYRSGLAKAYRVWVLRVWTLHGKPAGWTAQLSADLAAHPVFAELSGIVDGPWSPIGRFCNAHRLPCLFPETPLPSQRDGIDVYSMQFNDGLFLQARVAAAYLAARPSPPRRVTMLMGPGLMAAAPAATFARALGRDLPHARLVTRRVGAAGWPAAVRAVSASPVGSPVGTPDGTLVVWPGADPRPALAALAAAVPRARRIILPDNATAPARRLTGPLAARLRLIHPTAMPGAINPESFRTRQFLDARGVPVVFPRAQFEAYYAARLLRAAVYRLVSDFHRDYLMEWIEQEAENTLDPGVYPHLALGPGQRHASHGAYVVALDPRAPGGIRAASGWLVP